MTTDILTPDAGAVATEDPKPKKAPASKRKPKHDPEAETLTGKSIIPMPELFDLPESRVRMPMRVDCTLYGHPAARLFLCRLRISLEASGAKLANGKHVKGHTGALLWLLEQHAKYEEGK